jgi:trk system potassium uptake protein TrkA
MNVIITGSGRAGSHLAAILVARGDRVRLVGPIDQRVAELRPDLPADVPVVGDPTDPAVLEAAGIREAQVLVAVTDRDETNLVVTSLARFEYGLRRTIARVNEPRHAWLFGPEMGVDVALDQADLIGRLIADQAGDPGATSTGGESAA